MPYFVYRIRARQAVGSVRELEKIDLFSNYREARSLARQMRSALAAEGRKDERSEDGPEGSLEDGSMITVRVVFAADELQAEALLSESRSPRPLGEDA